jgi:phage shock protein E
MKFSLIGAVLLFAVATTAKTLAAEHTKDSLSEVKKAVESEKAVLIDVREIDEWNDGHLKLAKHLALSDLQKGVPADKLKTLLPKDKVVYLHCGSGRRCLKAADLLKAAGFETRALKPGYKELVGAGLEK